MPDLPMTATISRKDVIYRSLRQAIIEQALKPGAKLPEDRIGEQFGVSRTGVRGALVRLAAEGLVEIRPNRGAAVAEPSLEEAQDIFDMRRCLELLKEHVACPVLVLAGNHDLWRRETNSWRWPAFMVGYLFVLAYIAAGATYWTAVAFGLG